MRMCSAISFWIRSPCQGKVTIKILETIGQPTMARATVVICKQMGFSGAVQMPMGPDPYSTLSGNINRDQTPQGKVWQAPNPEYRHILFIKFMARFLQKYAAPYFSKVLIAGNKTVRDFPKYWINVQGNTDMCMHHILAK